MQRIAMLGSGFIGRFYAESLLGQRSKDKIVSIYSRREESAKKICSRLQMRSLDYIDGRSNCSSGREYGMYLAS